MVGDRLQVLPHRGGVHPRQALTAEVLGELELGLDGLLQHRGDLLGHLLVEEVGLLGADGVHHREGEVHVHGLVPEHPVGAGGQTVQQAPGPEPVHVREGAVEEQPLDAGREADQVEQEGPAVVLALQRVEVVDRVHVLEAELRLLVDGGDVLHRVEGRRPVLGIGQVGVEQRQVELDVHGLLEQLPGQVEPGLGGVDVLVEAQHHVVGDDRVTGGEEGDQTADHVPLAVAELGEVGDVGVQVHLLDGPGVLDRVAVLVVERRVAHRTERQLEARVEQHLLAVGGGAHWQASQDSGFSREQASAASSSGVRVVGAATATGADGAGTAARAAPEAAWAIRVAGRERR